MRTLLPDKLIEPTRFARQAPPEKVAIQLRDAAISGSNQIKDFKKAYHSEDMRALFQTASGADFPQGHDVWTIDYTKSLPAIKAIPASTAPTLGITTEEQSVASITDKFRELHPNLKLEVTESDQLPLHVTVGSMVFSIHSAKTQGQFEVAAKQGTTPDVNQIAILTYLNKAHPELGLPALLSLLASYNNLKSTPCRKCHKLIDPNFQLPVARQQLDPKDGAEPQWEILHESCL